jgi:hypothetical protein
MRERIAELAKANGRSMNAEIVQRLDWALSLVGQPKVVDSSHVQQPIGGALTWLLTTEIKDLADRETVSFDEMFVKIVLAGLRPDAPEVVYLPVFPGATKEDLRTALEATKGVVRPDAEFMVENLAKAPWAPVWMIELMKSKLPDFLAQVASHETDIGADIAISHSNGKVTFVEAKTPSESSAAGAKRVTRRQAPKG